MCCSKIKVTDVTWQQFRYDSSSSKHFAAKPFSVFCKSQAVKPKTRYRSLFSDNSDSCIEYHCRVIVFLQFEKDFTLDEKWQVQPKAMLVAVLQDLDVVLQEVIKLPK